MAKIRGDDNIDQRILPMTYTATSDATFSLLDQGTDSAATSRPSQRVLATLLTYGGLEVDAAPMAAALLGRFGSLGSVIHTPVEVLEREFHLPRRVTDAIEAVRAVYRAAVRERLPQRTKISSGQALRNFLADELKHRREEVLLGLFLDNDFGLIEVEEIAVGSVNRCPVTVRQIVERALAHGASAVILAHNHPSGRVEPSTADIRLTSTLQSTLASLDIELVEHVVVGDGTYSILSEQTYA